MHSVDRDKLFRFVHLSPTAYANGLAALVAMLICFAIVMNVGPFARTPNAGTSVVLAGQSSPPPMRATAGAKPVAPLKVVTRDLQDSDLAAGQNSFPEPIQVSIQPLNDPPIEIASAPLPAAPAAQPESDRANADKAAIVGVWAPDTGTCSARDFRDGVLPTVITTEGAWAGEAFCIFTKRTESEKGWKAVAKCSTQRESWTAHVRLKVSDNRLLWTSERGTQAYSRCAPDVLMAAR